MKYNSLRYATESLLDVEKNRAYLKAIKRIVNQGDIVVDCGAGTGILSILAAKEGAKAVFALESDEFVSRLAEENIRAAGVDNIVKVINCDASMYDGPTADVVITQLIDTMLIVEEQIKVVNALHEKKIINNKTALIPYRVTSFLQPVFYDFEFHDCQMPMIIQSRNISAADRIIDNLSTDVEYCDNYFTVQNETVCTYKGKNIAINKGWLNAIKFTSITHLMEGVIIGSTSDLCMPAIVPVHEMYVRAGELIDTEVQYEFGKGYETLRVKVC